MINPTLLTFTCVPKIVTFTVMCSEARDRKGAFDFRDVPAEDF